jgi:hypothetical protein
VVTIVRGDTILVRGIDRLCCEAHRNWVRQHIPPHKPELLALLRDGLEDHDLAPVLEEGRA